MEHTTSKRSCLTSERTHNQMLIRGHNSEITDVKWRRGHCRPTARRTFTFKGSQQKRMTSQWASKQRGASHTPASLRNTSTMQGAASTTAIATDYARAKRPHSTSRVRTPATMRSRSRSTVRQVGSQRPPSKAVSRANSAAGSQAASRRASSVAGPAAPSTSAIGVGALVAAATAAEPNLPPPPPPPPPSAMPSDKVNIHDVLGVHATSSSGDVKTEENKAVLSPAKSSDSEDESDDDRDEDGNDGQPEPNVTIELPMSPAVVEYRKVMYSEAEHKWIEHCKVVEDLKHERKRKKREAHEARLAWLAARAQPPAQKVVKGRSTPRMQAMFPTAIVRQDDRPGIMHNINMTDALRIELHKRKAPIVPTHYQRHILEFGKLPFRNNPRPHPVI